MSAEKISSPKKQIYKPGKIKGFPEWLPEERLVEQKWLDHIRRIFESYGFTSIETPAVEELNVLLAKGETDKEIYTLTRLQQSEEENSETRLGLHFDQTVPFARYTAQHFNDLTFPFKRYQMQKVWRGERPQLGRMREFLQCDIDVINVDHLPLHFDAEMAAIIYEILCGLEIGRVQLRISNRKILLGLMESLSIESSDTITHIFRQIDKLDKLGAVQVHKNIVELLSFNEEEAIKKARLILYFSCEFSGNFDTLLDEITNDELIDSSNKLLQDGLDELGQVLFSLAHLPEGSVIADLSIVRGLDYYTGTVYETRLLDIPEFTGSVCSGGRYDDLAGTFINKHLPGVGISIGFTRLFDVLRHHGYIKTGAKTPTDILVVLADEAHRPLAMETARSLRAQGYNVETYHAPQKISRQLSYAEKKGIPYVWFPELGEVKNMTTGEQSKAEVERWTKS
ncbi:MAG: histidine--tRNA ligase [Rhodospirillales bacterium]|nr:histidine--tRNA ligase [Rhodospirillales bacterium]MCB9973492.1 histidine--tRNA ligase [Rhodospirillales bacterium]MCB9980196.1 histidine--tRNA ligase [Rhodospirillales bacterium]